MTRSPLESAWHKYRWAQYHAQSVNSQLEGVFGADGDILTINVEVNQAADEATAIARIGRLPIIHERCGLALGDAIHNYRSALDHIAWNLVKIGRTPKPRKPKSVQFPMCNSGAEFKRAQPSRLPGVIKDQVAVIRRYQPYVGGVRGTSISRLNRLANMDKHRVLIPAVVTPAGYNIRVTSSWRHVRPPEFFIGNGRELKINAKVMEAEFVRSGAGDCHVNVQGNLQIYPSLGRGLLVSKALLQIGKTVLSVLESIEETL
ncbi:MAG: hypothetical protein WED83_02815 [Acidimicrobiia bacterium]